MDFKTLGYETRWDRTLQGKQSANFRKIIERRNEKEVTECFFTEEDILITHNDGEEKVSIALSHEEIEAMYNQIKRMKEKRLEDEKEKGQ